MTEHYFMWKYEFILSLLLDLVVSILRRPTFLAYETALRTICQMSFL